MHQMFQWVAEKWTVVATLVLNVNAEHWAALAAFLSAVVAIIQLFVGNSQKGIQRRQERLSLFEKRYDLFRRKNKCIHNVFQYPRMLNDNSIEIRNISFEVKCLFGINFYNKSSIYFDEIVDINYKILNIPQDPNGIKGRMWTQEIDINARPEMSSTDENEQKYFERLDKISLELDVMFEPHLVISKKDF